ncbi:lysozyme inhibitor LprI family protein [Enterobacter cloacae complex sp. ESBL7]|uniref:lysozyme inhibitor LprI family protein n=1 Tax=Enterobacter TaxID=547 RepID=UPI0035691ACF
MTILIKTLKIMASGVVFVSGLTTASSTVYFLPEAKSAGVASSDKNALMFLGMDRDVNLKGICFAMTKQSSSIVPLVDITATTDNGRFTMHGLRPNVSDTKEVACSFGSEAGDFLTAISKSTAVNMKLDFNGEIRNYSFDTTEFGKMLTANGKGVWEKAAKDYAQGVRAPVLYDTNHEAPKNNAEKSKDDTHSFKASDDKLNSVWKNLSSDTRKRLLPAQREWIRKKSQCNNEEACLTHMTENRIRELESENGK